LAIGFLIPVLVNYVRTGLVGQLPTLIVCGLTILAALQSFFAGLILSTIVDKNKKDFEMALLHADVDFKRLKSENK
jgi:spore maturation protein SpmA